MRSNLILTIFGAFLKTDNNTRQLPVYHHNINYITKVVNVVY